MHCFVHRLLQALLPAWLGVLGCASAPLTHSPDAKAEVPVQVVAGYGESCVRMNTGAVYCWGRNGGGVLIGIDEMYIGEPMQVPGLVARDIGLSTWGMCAIDAAGQVMCQTDEAGEDLWHIEQAAGSCRVQLAGYFACAEQCDDGNLVCWDLETPDQAPFLIPDARAPWVLTPDRLLYALEDGTFEGRSRSGERIGLPTDLEIQDLDTYAEYACIVGLDGRERCHVRSHWVPRSEIDDSIWGGCRLRDEKVACWGDNTFGRLGADPLEIASRTHGQPIHVKLPAVAGLATGDSFNCVLTIDQRVLCWGLGWYNQLGDGTQRRHVPPVKSRGQQVFTDIYGLARGMCARTEEKKVFCWGRVLPPTAPADSNNFAGEPTPMRWLDGADTVVDGYRSICAQRQTGTTCYDASGTSRQPLECVSAMVAVDGNDCCLNDTAAVRCTAANSASEPEDLTEFAARFPSATSLGPTRNGLCVTTQDALVCSTTDPTPDVSYPMSSPRFLGPELLVDANGAYYTWKEHDRRRELLPLDLPTDDVPTQIHSGSDVLCALYDNNEVWCRYDTTEYGTSPPGFVVGQWGQVSIPPVTQIAGGWGHACALDLEGQTWCWGFGGEGALGNGTMAYEWRPVTVKFPEPRGTE